MKNGGGHTPLPEDETRYSCLVAVKKTLEWVHLLVKTKARSPDRYDELMGHRHIANGPTHACLYH
jgi:hypothetical protein